jgi:histidyl-tRNA synthetase
MPAFQTPKGFRDFFPEDCARRNYIFQQWRTTAARHGFVEYEGPMVESTDLYRKKSGTEITEQLFCFTTKGDEEISMRPEVTPTLARMVALKQRHYSKPMKWFQIGPCFRYERPQRGRGREFYQFNVDILGEISPAADAELVTMCIESLRSFGLQPGEFIIRLSDRKLWTAFMEERGISGDGSASFLQIIDKLERAKPEDTDAKLQPLGLSLETVKQFIGSVNEDHPIFAPLRENLKARGLWEFVKIDPGIVRGLAYYTGCVFEAFDVKHGLRAIAGGGRYDNLISLISDGEVDMPACGFAMGDVVLGELIEATPAAKTQFEAWQQHTSALDVYVIIADEAQRPNALALLQQLRTAGWRADAPFTAQKMGKQFQAAEGAKARFAIIVGSEYPTLSVKNLRTRAQSEIQAVQALEKFASLAQTPDYGNLIA